MSERTGATEGSWGQQEVPEEVSGGCGRRESHREQDRRRRNTSEASVTTANHHIWGGAFSHCNPGKGYCSQKQVGEGVLGDPTLGSRWSESAESEKCKCDYVLGRFLGDNLAP